MNALTSAKREEKFLAYLASRINWEVDRLERAEQSEAEGTAHIRQLADLAREVLGTGEEVEGWLEAATRAAELLAPPSTCSPMVPVHRAAIAGRGVDGRERSASPMFRGREPGFGLVTPLP
jgi:hypothetical protein